MPRNIHGRTSSKLPACTRKERKKTSFLQRIQRGKKNKSPKRFLSWICSSSFSFSSVTRDRKEGKFCRSISGISAVGKSFLFPRAREETKASTAFGGAIARWKERKSERGKRSFSSSVREKSFSRKENCTQGEETSE